jgi:flagellar assembly protein FliH
MATMTSVRKFTFETDFDALALAEAEAAATPPEPTFSQADLATARKEGFVQGRTQALAEAATATERLCAQALEAIGRALPGLAAVQTLALDDYRRAAVAIAAAIAGKIAPEVARQTAAEGVAALVAERLPELVAEPRVVVRVASGQLEAIKSRIEAIAARCGFSGQLVLLGEDGLAEPDCRIEWADGGTEKILARVAGEIDRAVASYLGEAPQAAEPASEPVVNTSTVQP